MASDLVGQHQLATFTTPSNGQSPIDANQVKGNDNTIKTSYNAHDSDYTIHFQSSTAAARPAAATAGDGAKWIDNDTYRVYYSDGSAWHEIAYLPTGTITGPITISGTLTATDLVATASILSGSTITASYASATVVANATSGNPAFVLQKAGAVKSSIATSTNDEIIFLNHSGTAMGNITGAVMTVASFVGALTGNASTATALQTARTINGTAFDGTANITITAGGSVVSSVATSDTSGIGATYTTLCTALSGLTAGNYIVRGWYTSKSSAGATGSPQVQLLASSPGNVTTSRYTVLNPTIATGAGPMFGGTGLIASAGVGGDTSGSGFSVTHHVTWWVQLSGTTDLTLQGKSTSGGETQAFGAGTNITVTKV